MLQPRLVSIADGAVILGVCVDLVRQFVESGALVPVRVPRPVTLRQHRRGAAGAHVRRCLLDVQDLHRLVDQWREASRD
ncbi:hypothetical protein KF840_23075 [bacterium]|nr:hypothetical protein [bacterium]